MVPWIRRRRSRCNFVGFFFRGAGAGGNCLLFLQVYVATSGKAGGGQGLFARRQFLPGELVSYLSGVKTMAEEFLFDNMTLEEEEDAASYFFNLDEESPRWWGLPEGQVAEIMHRGIFEKNSGDRYSARDAQHIQVPNNHWPQDQLRLL